MLKLLILLGLLIGSSVCAVNGAGISDSRGGQTAEAQRGTPIPLGNPNFPGSEYIGSFLYVLIIDRITGKNNSYVVVTTKDTQLAVLKLTCLSGSYPEWRIFSDQDPVMFSDNGLVVWRFDSGDAGPERYVTRDIKLGYYAGYMTGSEFAIAFSKGAYSAKPVGIRLYSGAPDQKIDFFFPLNGYFKAVKRLPCARAFGF